MTVVLLALLLTGCDDPIEQPGAKPWTPPASQAPGARWPDRVTADDAGVMAAPGFNAHVDAVAPDWGESADSTVSELLNLNGGFDGPVEIFLLRDKNDDDPVLTVTLTHLGDDSVDAERYRIALHRGADGRFRFVDGKRTVRCQAGRGHQSFEPTRCS